MSTGLETFAIPPLIPPAARCLECPMTLAFHNVFRHVKETSHAILIAADARALELKTQLLPTEGMIARLESLAGNMRSLQDAVQMQDQVIAALHELIDVRTGTSKAPSFDPTHTKDSPE